MGAVDLKVGTHFVIPEGELRWSFSTSGGPGGQHANRNATKAELRWEVATSPAITEEVRAKLTSRLGVRVRGGEVKVIAGESRSQWRNRQAARKRLAELLEGALHDRRRRVATKPSKSSRDSRLDDKRRQGAKKRLRDKPDVD